MFPMTDTPALALTYLQHERLLAFTGQENRKFLQGQLTCDVSRLKKGELTLGACCNAKGRMVANFRIHALEESLVLSLPVNQDQALKEHLGKYAMFFRTVEISETSSDWIRIGLSGVEAASEITQLTNQPAPKGNQITEWEHGLALAVPGSNRYELWLKPEATACKDALEAKARVLPIESWQLEDIRDGIAWVSESTRETYIPQHLNWQALEGVSFSKGCYTGQEIVARMKYLGKLKSHLYRFFMENPQAPAAGTPVMNSNGSKSGEIVTALPSGSGTELLAVVRSADVESGRLTLASTESSLNLQPLPYEV